MTDPRHFTKISAVPAMGDRVTARLEAALAVAMFSMKACRHCGSSVPAEAIVCLYCGRYLRAPA